MSSGSDLAPAQDLVAFINAAPTPYHAVEEAVRRLKGRGFSALDERDDWRMEPGGRHYVIRGGGTLVAFVVGQKPPAESGFVLVGAHTDSPNLRVKPAPDVTASGYRQIAVEVYGGVLWSTWLDRDLSLAGRVTLRGGDTRLVRFERTLCRIPNVAIHLNRDVNNQGLLLNAQNHLMPLSGLHGKSDDSRLLPLVAAELSKAGGKVSVEDILGWDLCLFDVMPAAIGGVQDELVLAPRLDNLASCHAALQALFEAGAAGEATRVVALYDHEEVGSQSAAGAKSRFLSNVLDRVATGFPNQSSQATARAFSRSFMISADMAHALHPNYAEKHDKGNAPVLGKGPVIKVNSNQSYASDAPGIALFAAACAEANAAAQRFASRNDQPCGSTIGPISAAAMGIRTVDVGNPMLSMHSCRETAAVADVAPMIRALSLILSSKDLPPPTA